MSKSLYAEFVSAIKERIADSFEMETSGGMKHFISCEDQKKGLYIGVITSDDGKEFKVYMI